MQVYENVRAYLEEKGIKQNAIARKCDISAPIFNAIMTGRRKLYAEDLRKICSALEVSPEILLKP